MVRGHDHRDRRVDNQVLRWREGCSPAELELLELGQLLGIVQLEFVEMELLGIEQLKFVGTKEVPAVFSNEGSI